MDQRQNPFNHIRINDADQAKRTVKSFSGCTVLIVEDEEDTITPLDYRLRKEQFETVLAGDGLMACQLIERIIPDLILLDIMLPGMNGWDVCRFIRDHDDERISSTPVIMLTALADQENKIQGLEIGADVYIPKPFSVKEVLLNCRRLAKQRRWRSILLAEMDRLRVQEKHHADFQSLLCHELLAQLTVIDGLCGRLIKKLSESENNKNIQYLEMIRKGSSYLNSVSEEILLMGKVVTGDLELPRKEFDLDVVVHEVLALYEQPATAKNMIIRADGAVQNQVVLNKSALKIILSSLLENALKYSHPETKIWLRYNVDTEGRLLLDVWDQGPGIPAMEHEKIFEKYYRGRTFSTKTKGSGLGLYVVRKLSEAMEGKIKLQSTEGVGSRFQLLFPAGMSANGICSERERINGCP